MSYYTKIKIMVFLIALVFQTFFYCSFAFSDNQFLLKQEISSVETNINALKASLNNELDSDVIVTIQSLISMQEGKLQTLKTELVEFTRKLNWLFEVNSGYQNLGYQEHSQFFSLDSDAKVSNIHLNSRIECFFDDEYFIGIKGSASISKNKSQEKWWNGALLAQTDDLTYGITMIDLYGGTNYQQSHAFYGGTRFFIGEQLRNNIVAEGKSLNLEAVETINSFGFFGGFRAENQYDINLPSWIYGGEVELFISFFEKTKNSFVSGIEIIGTGGYMITPLLKGGYHFSKNLNVELQTRYSLIHWNGGSYYNYAYLIEWPSNDTQNFTVTLAFKSFM